MFSRSWAGMPLRSMGILVLPVTSISSFGPPPRNVWRILIVLDTFGFASLGIAERDLLQP
jgi:hypothetical protein